MRIIVSRGAKFDAKMSLLSSQNNDRLESPAFTQPHPDQLGHQERLPSRQELQVQRRQQVQLLSTALGLEALLIGSLYGLLMSTWLQLQWQHLLNL